MLCMMNLLSSHEGEISLREIDCFAAFSTIVISFFTLVEKIGLKFNM